MRKIMLVIFTSLIVLLMIGCETINKYTVTYKATEGGRISGELFQTVAEGASTEIVKAISYENYHFVKWSDGITTEKRIDDNIINDVTFEAIFEKDDYIFPTILIDTNNQPIVSKDDYLDCLVSIEDKINSEFELTEIEAKIKGRGNSTWGMPKKPYKLKFNKKIDLFGNGKAKTWTLIANYCDKSLARNYLAFNLANYLDPASVTTSCKFVELYLNGSYEGVYLVCEQVEVGVGRVDVETDYTTTNTGYLIELDYKVYEEPTILDEDYFLCDGVPYAIKSPDKEDVDIKEYLAYIKTYFNKCIKALKTGTFDEVSELIDINSFVQGYIVQELFKNVDVMHSSWYLYKDQDSKLYSGPLWDFDISAGNCDYNSDTIYDNMYARNRNYWYKLLFKFPEFNALIKDYLISNYYDILEYLNKRIDNLYMSKDYFDKNFTKWKVMGVYIWPNTPEIVKLKTWEDNIEQVRLWLAKSLYYMFNYYCK